MGGRVSSGSDRTASPTTARLRSTASWPSAELVGVQVRRVLQTALDGAQDVGEPLVLRSGSHRHRVGMGAGRDLTTQRRGRHDIDPGPGARSAPRQCRTRAGVRCRHGVRSTAGQCRSPAWRRHGQRNRTGAHSSLRTDQGSPRARRWLAIAARNDSLAWSRSSWNQRTGQALRCR